MDVGDIDPDPIAQFERWLADAARVAARADRDGAGHRGRDGRPSARHVLLKGIDHRGFVWFTNYESAKARDLRANPRAALVFPWFPIRRQVIVSGTVSVIDEGESDAYFATRDRASQIGAWASPQSEVIPDRQWLEQRVAERRGPVRGRRRSPSAALGRLPTRARSHRALAQPARPPARPVPLRTHDGDGWIASHAP